MTYAWFDVTRNAGIARIMHMSYRSKTYTWNDVILVKRSMIRFFFFLFLIENMAQFLQTPARQVHKQPCVSPDSAHRVNCIYEKNVPPGETVPEIIA